MNLYSRPSISLPRLARVVAETESAMLASSSISLRARVDLPAPEGLESANIRPRRATCSFNIGGLLLDLIDRHFHVQPDSRQLQVCGFRAERVGLAGELLAQEIQATAGGLGLGEERTQFGGVGGEAFELLLHIGLGGGERGLLREARRIELHFRRKALEALQDAFAHRVRDFR